MILKIAKAIFYDICVNTKKLNTVLPIAKQKFQGGLGSRYTKALALSPKL